MLLSVTSRREILTSRREILTSRRQNVTPLPRRDVNHHVATSIFDASSRRDVRFHVATSFYYFSVTSRREILTSRRQLVMPSATSRRGISRRDVGKSALCHVATWPRTSRRETGFKPGIGHFLAFIRANLSPKP